LEVIEHNVEKDEKMSKMLGEEFKKEIPENESRWTKEGLLDIREEYKEEKLEEEEEVKS